MGYGSALDREPKLARPPNNQKSALLTVNEDIEQRMGDQSDSGQLRLEELGYKQELSRRFGVLSSSCACFSLMSFMTGISGK